MEGSEWASGLDAANSRVACSALCLVCCTVIDCAGGAARLSKAVNDDACFANCMFGLVCLVSTQHSSAAAMSVCWSHVTVSAVTWMLVCTGLWQLDSGSRQ
jgi:hypothetical protein